MIQLVFKHLTTDFPRREDADKETVIDVPPVVCKDGRPGPNRFKRDRNTYETEVMVLKLVKNNEWFGGTYTIIENGQFRKTFTVNQKGRVIGT